MNKLSGKKEFLTYLLIIFVIVSFGFYLRATNLTEPSFVDDEYLHVYAAKSILGSEEPTLPSGEIYDRAILYTYLVAFSFKVLGVNEYAARIPSVIFGTLSIILVFFIGRRLFGTLVGIISAFLVAFVPLEIAWSRECRFYAMYQFFYLLGFYAFYNGLEGEVEDFKKRALKASSKGFRAIASRLSNWNIDLGWLLISIVSIFIAFSLQPLTVLLYGSVISYLFLMFIITSISQGLQKAIRTKYFLFFVLSAISGVIGLISLVLENPTYLKATAGYSPVWAGDSKPYAYRYFIFLNSYYLFPIGAFFVLGAIRIFTRLHKAGFYTVVCTGVPLMAHSFFASVGAPRYILDIFPLILLVSSYFMYDFFKTNLETMLHSISAYKNVRFQPSGRLVRAALMCLFILLFLPISWWFRHSFKTPGYMMSVRSEDIGGRIHGRLREACLYVRNIYKPGDIVIASTPLGALYYCGTVDYRLNNGDLGNVKNEDRSSQDPLNVKAIKDLGFLKKVLSQHPHGWIIIDIDEWRNTNDISSDISEFISSNLTRHNKEVDETILVFSWGKRYQFKAKND